MSIPSYYKNSILPGTKTTTRLVDRFEKTYILFESATLTYLPIAWLKKSSTFQRLLEEKCLYKVQAASLTDFQGPGGKEKRKGKHSTHFFCCLRGLALLASPAEACHSLFVVLSYCGILGLKTSQWGNHVITSLFWAPLLPRENVWL